MAFNTKGYELIQADDRPGFLVWMAAGDIPAEKTFDTIGTVGQSAAAVVAGTSTSSITIGAVDTLVTFSTVYSAHPAGRPFFLTDDATPDVNWIWGLADTDQALNGDITLRIKATGGAGSPAAWHWVVAGFVTSAIVTPLLIADGGTSATTDAGVRSNFKLKRLWKAEAALHTDPGATPAGTTYVVRTNPAGGGPAAGLFVGQEENMAISNGVTYDFTTPDIGDMVNVQLTGSPTREVWQYQGVAEAGKRWPTSFWASVSPTAPEFQELTTTPTETLLAGDLAPDKVFICTPGAGMTVELPDAGGLSAPAKIRFVKKATGTLTISTAGFGSIFDAGVPAVTFVVSGSAVLYTPGGLTEWYVIAE